MKKVLGSIVLLLLGLTAILSMGAACTWTGYQPKLPKSLER